jgi:hypothetical protein
MVESQGELSRRSCCDTHADNAAVGWPILLVPNLRVSLPDGAAQLIVVISD